VEKLELSDVAGGNVEWFSHHGTKIQQFLKKINMKLPYDLAIQFLVYTSEELKQLSTVEHNCNPNSQKVETRGSTNSQLALVMYQVRGQSWLHSWKLFQKTNKRIETRCSNKNLYRDVHSSTIHSG
jgi:hypothetical protein